MWSRYCISDHARSNNADVMGFRPGNSTSDAFEASQAPEIAGL